MLRARACARRPPALHRPLTVAPWQYYPDAEDVYPGAETTVQDEDTQPLEKPIIAPVRTKNFDHVEKRAPVNPYSMTYLHQLLGNPALVRNIVLAGHLHHGKSSFMDCLVRGARPAAPRRACVNVNCASVCLRVFTVGI